MPQDYGDEPIDLSPDSGDPDDPDIPAPDTEPGTPGEEDGGRPDGPHQPAPDDGDDAGVPWTG